MFKTIKRKLSLVFFHPFALMSWMPCIKINRLSYFYHPSPFEGDIIFKTAGTRRCNNVRFWLYFGRDVGKRCCNGVTTLCFQRRYYNQKLTLLQHCVFRPGINVAATSWFWCNFPDENLNVFQYHHNFLFPKICNIALQLHFLIKKIYSVCVNAKRSLK